MAGTITGGKRAAQRNKEKYGEDFYKKIGALGGKKGSTGKGFAAGEEGRERARLAGQKGGKTSKRTKKEL